MKDIFNGLKQSNEMKQTGNVPHTIKRFLSCNPRRFETFQPQHALPDVFLWMIQDGKRIAFARIPARHIAHSIVDEERGKECSKIMTLFLRVRHRFCSELNDLWGLPFVWLLPFLLACDNSFFQPLCLTKAWP